MNVGYIDYFSDLYYGKRILVVSDLKKGDALKRRYERITGKVVNNVDIMTIDQLAEYVYFYYQSEEGFDEQYERIDDDEAMMLMRNVILENSGVLEYFTDEKMLNMATAGEIYSKICLVRGNGWSDRAQKADNRRIRDLKLLAERFEQVLSDKKMLDRTALISYALTKLKESGAPIAEAKLIFAAKISYLAEEVETYMGIRKKLLEMLSDSDGSTVEVYHGRVTADSLKIDREKVEFFRGYGSFNEASYVANDILRRKDEIPFGSITVMFSSDMQLPAICAALRGNGIPMNIVSSYSAGEKSYVNYARKILEWAKDDFSEKALESVLACEDARIHYVYVQKDTVSDEAATADSRSKEESVNNEKIYWDENYYDYVLHARRMRDKSVALGWGYARNREFIEAVRQYETDAGSEFYSYMVKMHAAMLDIFGVGSIAYSDANKVRPYVIFEKLLGFMKEYGHSGEEYCLGLAAMSRLSGVIAAEERALTLDEAIRFINEVIQGLTVSDSERSSAVNVQRISGWTILERDCVYMIGLSLKELQGNTTESPVLFDEEMETLLGEGYTPTVIAGEELKAENLLRTVASFAGKHLILGYSSYDTVGFLANNPSVFFRTMLDKLSDKQVDELPEFVYGNPLQEITYDKKEVEETEPGAVIYDRTSPSAIEKLLDCPKAYAYGYVYKIPDNSFSECDYKQWLDAKLRGSFFHELVENYVNDRLTKPTGELYESEIDSEYVNSLARNLRGKYLKMCQVPVQGQDEREIRELAEVAGVYLKNLCENMNATGKRTLLTEQKFEKVDYIVTDYNNKEHKFSFRGFIDRIDYRLVTDEKKVLISVVDYKTGSRDKKADAMERGALIQCTVYAQAVLCGEADGKLIRDILLEKIADREKNTDITGWNLEFEQFVYDFPMESEGSRSFEISAEYSANARNITRLRAILTLMQDIKCFPDHIELYEGIKKYAEQYGEKDPMLGSLLISISGRDRNGLVPGVSKNETHLCAYCPYGNVCINRKAGRIDAGE